MVPLRDFASFTARNNNVVLRIRRENALAVCGSKPTVAAVHQHIPRTLSSTMRNVSARRPARCVVVSLRYV